MKFYPLMINLEGRPVVIVGGGSVASRKAAGLIDAGALVTVIAPDFSDQMRDLKKRFPQNIELVERVYRSGDISGPLLVFTAADDPSINRQVSNDAQRMNLPVNNAADPENSSFHVPSFMRKGDLILAVATGGSSPAMAARIRRDLEKHIPHNVEDMLFALGRIRDILKSDAGYDGKTPKERSEILAKIVHDDGLLGRITGFRDNDLKLRSIIDELM